MSNPLWTERQDYQAGTEQDRPGHCDATIAEAVRQPPDQTTLNDRHHHADTGEDQPQPARTELVAARAE
jgi:hypothetical protein